MNVGASSLLFQNTTGTVRGPPVACESARWMIAAISLDSSFHSTCRLTYVRWAPDLVGANSVRTG